MRPSGRPTAPFSVSAAAARPPPGLVHRKAAAAARSRAAAALVMLVSAAALFFVVAARGSGGIDHEASPLSTAASSSRPSVRPSVGTRSVSASGGEEKSDKRVEAAAAAAAEEDGAEDASSKKSCAPPPLQPPQQPSVFFARPVRELRHDGSAFTQGLEFDRICEGPHALDGGGGCRDVLWESTGLNGKSTVRLVDLESGKALRTTKLPDDAFGEGLTKVPTFASSSGGEKSNNASTSTSSSTSSSAPSSRLFQLTWLSGRAFWHDADLLLNSTDAANGAPKNPAEALGGAIDDALNRRTGGAKKSSSSTSSKLVSSETRTPLLDGWGAAFVPAASAIALSDGSSKITFADARNVSRALRTITVTDEGEEGGEKRVEVFNLNELEWVPAGAVKSLLSSSSAAASAVASNETATATTTTTTAKDPLSLFGGLGGKKTKRSGNASLSDGELWANVWGTPCVARVDPATGAVVGWVLAPDLRPRALAAAVRGSSTPFSSSPQGQIDVLNGIAVDDGTREPTVPPLSRARLFMTGKNWPLLFEVKLEKAGGSEGGSRSGGGGGANRKATEPSSSSSSSSSTSSSSQQQQAALTAARGSCIRPVADFG